MGEEFVEDGTRGWEEVGMEARWEEGLWVCGNGCIAARSEAAPLRKACGAPRASMMLFPEISDVKSGVD